MLSGILIAAAIIAIAVFFAFWPELKGTLRKKWPGIFETDNPIPDEMPGSWMLYCMVSIFCIILVGLVFGGFAAFMTFIVALIVGLGLMHGVPYVRHQYRRLSAK